MFRALGGSWDVAKHLRAVRREESARRGCHSIVSDIHSLRSTKYDVHMYDSQLAPMARPLTLQLAAWPALSTCDRILI